MAAESARRAPLSRERVLQAAMEIVDDGGIDALSMRRLGHALGVEAMSLYRYVANKDDLLHGITELVLNEFELPPATDGWEAAIRRCAVTAHDALIRHPWACTLILSGNSVQQARLDYIEWMLRTLRESGFSEEEAFHAYHTIDSHILGFTLWQLGHAMPSNSPMLKNTADIAALLSAVLPGISIGEYPYLIEHGMQHLMAGSRQGEGEFEFGLRLLLDGLSRMRGPR